MVVTYIQIRLFDTNQIQIGVSVTFPPLMFTHIGRGSAGFDSPIWNLQPNTLFCVLSEFIFAFFFLFWSLFVLGLSEILYVLGKEA